MKKKKTLRVIVVCVVVAAVIVAAIFAGARGNQPGTAYNTYVVKTGNIENVVKRTGQMAAAEGTDIMLDNGVTVSEVLVRVNDTVEADTRIAALDAEALELLLREVTAELDAAEQALRALNGEKTTDKITAPVSGRIKGINRDNYGSDVLMRISLDGKMKVVFTADREIDVANAEILVETADGERHTGTIIDREGSTYTVTISDKTATYGGTATVYADDQSVGSGTVEISTEYVVTGALENISGFVVSVNDTIEAGAKLASLKSSVPTAKYAQALRAYSRVLDRQRALAALAADPYLYAGTSGVVSALYIADHTMHAGTADRVVAAQVTPAQSGSFVTTIPEYTISEVQVGMPAVVTLTAYPDRALNAVVSYINPVGIVASGAASYEVHFQLEDTQGLMLGMTGTVVFASESAENCVVLPMELVREKDGAYYVLVNAEDGSAVEKQVEIGISNEDYVQVTGGIAEGDTVLYTGTLSTQG